jgi:hypothetical protein
MKKKIQNASKPAQKAWHNFPGMLKSELRRVLPDSDHDGVPNGFDCHPKNKRKQEEFLQQDEQYLDSHPLVKMGKFLGKGCVGQVREIRGNPNLVVKTVRSYEGKEGEDVVESIRDGKFATKELKVEANFFTKNKLEKEPLFIPTRVVKIGPEKKLGLIHPKVHDRVEYYPHFHIEGKNGKSAFTPSRLKTLRQHIIDLSYKGFVFVDGLQIGVDDAGRILQYDIGFMQRDKPGSDRPFEVNNVHWQEFISEFGGPQKYGSIVKNKGVKRTKK